MTVQVGDVFQDLDKRLTYVRRFEVIDIDETPRGPVAVVDPFDGARITRISVARMLTPRLFRRVDGAERAAEPRP